MPASKKLAKQPRTLWLPDEELLPFEIYPEIAVTVDLLNELKIKWPGITVALLNGREILAVSGDDVSLDELSRHLFEFFKGDVRYRISKGSYVSLYEPGGEDLFVENDDDFVVVYGSMKEQEALKEALARNMGPPRVSFVDLLGLA